MSSLFRFNRLTNEQEVQRFLIIDLFLVNHCQWMMIDAAEILILDKFCTKTFSVDSRKLASIGDTGVKFLYKSTFLIESVTIAELKRKLSRG